MNITYLSRDGEYEIPIKLFEPEKGEITGFTVAAHGFGGDMESSAISRLARKLTKHGMAVVAFDFPGHGTSTADEYFRVANCRRDLLSVVDFAQQRYPKAVTTGIFATSFGGYITLLALEELPPDVKIVLRAPAVNMKKTFESSLMDLSMDKFKENGQVEIGFGRKVQVSYGFYEDLCQNDISTIDFNKEMLIIHGGKDTVVLPEDIQWFHAYNPRSRLKTIWCADHLFRYKNSLDEAVEDAANWILGI